MAVGAQLTAVDPTAYGQLTPVGLVFDSGYPLLSTRCTGVRQFFFPFGTKDSAAPPLENTPPPQKKMWHKHAKRDVIDWGLGMPQSMDRPVCRRHSA